MSSIDDNQKEQLYAMRGFCPFSNDHLCHVHCMLFVTAADSDIVRGDISEGEGHCGIAVLASHVASEKHAGGNYLIKTIGYSIKDKNE